MKGMAPALVLIGAQSSLFVSSQYLTDYGSLKYQKQTSSKLKTFQSILLKLSPLEFNGDIL